MFKLSTIKTVILAFALLVMWGCKNIPVKSPHKFTDEIELNNGIVWLRVSPSAGRIVSFGKNEDRDLLWRNSTADLEEEAQRQKKWLNYGGDKVWPAVQYSWKRIFGREWPPVEEVDGRPWEIIERQKQRLVMESPVLETLHIKIRREIILEGKHAAVTIKNTIEKISDSPYPLCVWTITQIKPPVYCLFGIEKKLPYKNGLFTLFEDYQANTSLLPDNRALKFSATPGQRSKIGTFGSWIAAVYPDCIFRQSTKYYPGECYPDNASLECFWDDLAHEKWAQNWSPKYAELELLGPSRHILAGKSLTNTVRWEIIDLSESPDEYETISNLCDKSSS